MLSVDEGSDAAVLLCLCDGMDGERGLTGRLRTIDFYDTSLRVAANAESGVQTDTAGRYDLDIIHLLVAELHDGSLAEVFFYL